MLYVVTGGASKVRPERPGAEAMANARTESWAAEPHFLLVTVDGPSVVTPVPAPSVTPASTPIGTRPPV